MKKRKGKTIIVFVLLLFTTSYVFSQKTNKHVSFIIQTEFGDIKGILYDETPKHRDNFINLANSGFYNGLLFHRVIEGFMIQGGDPNSKNAKPGEQLGSGGLDNAFPPEFNPTLTHKRGALAAARKWGQANPQMASNSSQFYIVQSEKGAHHLDGQYTVFGEVTQGFDIVDRIAAVKKDKYDRPLKDIKMIKCYTEGNPLIEENSETNVANSEKNRVKDTSLQLRNELPNKGLIILSKNQQQYLAARFYGSKLDSLEIISDRYKELLPDRNGNGIIYTTKSTSWGNVISYDDGGSTLNLKNGSVKFKISDVFTFSIIDSQYFLIQEMLNKMQYQFGAIYKIPIPQQLRNIENLVYLAATVGNVNDCEKYLSEFQGKNKVHEMEITNRRNQMLFSYESFDNETNRIKYNRYRTMYDNCVAEYEKNRFNVTPYGNFLKTYSAYDPDKLMGEAKFMFDLTKAALPYDYLSGISTISSLKDLILIYPSKKQKISDVAFNFIKSFENSFQFSWKTSTQMEIEVRRINYQISEINKFKNFFPNINLSYLNNLIAKGEEAKKTYNLRIPEEKSKENQRAQNAAQKRETEKFKALSGAVIQEGEWDDDRIEIKLKSLSGKTLASGHIKRLGNEYGIETDVFGIFRDWFKTYKEALNEIKIRLYKSARNR